MSSSLSGAHAVTLRHTRRRLLSFVYGLQRAYGQPYRCSGMDPRGIILRSTTGNSSSLALLLEEWLEKTYGLCLSLLSPFCGMLI